MTDPDDFAAVLTDTELAEWKQDLEQGLYDGVLADIGLRLVATVEQVRRERDAAEAPSVELVQALLESENVVNRLTAERDAAWETTRNVLLQVSIALGLPLTEAGRHRANSFLYREIGRFIECHDWAWPPSPPVSPDTPTPTGQT